MTDTTQTGIVLLVHGGSPAWNQAVDDLATGLRERHQVMISAGMNNVDGLKQAAARLVDLSCQHIQIVRMSIYSPVFNARHTDVLEELNNQHPDIRFTLHSDGLVNATQTDQILLDRAKSLSIDAENERILLLAHGAAEDDADRVWIETLEKRARLIKETIAPDALWCTTLREDWPEKRRDCEKHIRNWIHQAHNDNKQVLVIPVRLFGFGPYESVLEGLEYRSSREALLPHPIVGEWVESLVYRES